MCKYNNGNYLWDSTNKVLIKIGESNTYVDGVNTTFPIPLMKTSWNYWDSMPGTQDMKMIKTILLRLGGLLLKVFCGLMDHLLKIFMNCKMSFQT